uniref:Carbonic anhydrase-related protein VIII n=1 Tax=Pinctada fucata TaxID=50426 RepID=E5RQ31_PINFU|nr:carbonic anhydrase-related protein VIII [Pinctada fucata]
MGINTFREANGKCQSPINLVSECACFDQQLLKHPLSVNYTTSRETDILNDGQNVIIYPRYKGVISGGPLPSGYEFELSEIRFHWGRYSTRGSEHKVNGKAFPMEVQLVHWNSSQYQSYETALGKDSGVVILSLFVQIGKDNSGLRSLFPDSLNEIAYKGRQKTTNAPFNPSCLLPDIELRDYWTYEGSITIPPCSEKVTWIIFRYPLMLSGDQVDDFRRLYLYQKGETPPGGAEGRLLDNFRPVQPLNDRIVRSSFQ